jgi:hypothetical protein
VPTSFSAEKMQYGRIKDTTKLKDMGRLTCAAILNALTQGIRVTRKGCLGWNGGNGKGMWYTFRFRCFQYMCIDVHGITLTAIHLGRNLRPRWIVVRVPRSRRSRSTCTDDRLNLNMYLIPLLLAPPIWPKQQL